MPELKTRCSVEMAVARVPVAVRSTHRPITTSPMSYNSASYPLAVRRFGTYTLGTRRFFPLSTDATKTTTSTCAAPVVCTVSDISISRQLTILFLFQTLQVQSSLPGYTAGFTMGRKISLMPQPLTKQYKQKISRLFGTHYNT